MKRKLIIHIGMGKTGSSSIQKTLREHRKKLKIAGVQYLGLMLEHTELDRLYEWQLVSGWRIYRDLPQPQACTELFAVFEQLNQQLPDSIHTLIWSNESLFDSPAAVGDALQHLNTIYDIHVVGYIRSPDGWINSAYTQWGIKHKTYKGPLQRFRRWAKQRRYVVTPHVNAWQVLAQRADFLSFDGIADIGQHFIEHFLPESLQSISPKRDNDTPPGVALAMFAYHNSRFADEVLPEQLEPLLKQSELFNKQQAMPAFNQLLPTEEDIKEFLQDNAREIEQVNALLSASGQPSFDISHPKFKDNSVNQQDINRALLQLIVHLNQQIGELKTQLQQIKGQ
jgi:hypothetical protein